MDDIHLVQALEELEWLIVFAKSSTHLLVKIVAFLYVGKQSRKEVGLAGITACIVLVQFGELCSFGNGLVYSAQFVYQFQTYGILTEIDMALCNLIHLLDLHLSAVRYAFEEEGIAAIDITLQYGLLLLL